MKKHLLFSTLGLVCLLSCVAIWASVSRAALAQLHTEKTGAGERVTVRAAGRGNPLINLQDGIEVTTTYADQALSQQPFKQDQSQPRALASADFDEDGMPDLIAGYASPQSNTLSLRRGNADSIYPNSLEAKQHKADDSFTDAAFYSSTRLFEISESPDFIAAGDFDADGHWDIVAAARGSKTLYFLSGDGRGNFAAAKQIDLPGKVTALVSGDINRPDGLTDLVVAVIRDDGPKAMVFEGPEGALKSQPEIFPLPAQATSLAIGRFDEDSWTDFAAAAGRELIIAHGRDRRLSLDAARRAEVPPAILDHRLFAFDIKAVSVGDFTGANETGFALLSSDGSLFIAGGSSAQSSGQKAKKKAKASEAQAVGQWPGATQLVCARVSSGPADDLLVLDGVARKIHVLTSMQHASLTAGASPASLRAAASLDTQDEPLAILPMRLNGDALNDLVVLQSGHSSPAVVKTATAATFTVNKTDDHDDGVCDSGDCTLREAILAAEANPGADTIAFNIPGPAPHQLNVTSQLPAILNPIIIDGTTQPGFGGTPIIELTQQVIIISDSGLDLRGGSSTVRGLVINRFNRAGIVLSGPGNNIIEGNFIGTDVTGNIALPNDAFGVSVVEGNGNLIGGTTAQARNVISGNDRGVVIGSSGNFIQGNFIGTNAAGTARLGNQDGGVDISGPGFPSTASNNLIGGTTAGARNLISGNGGIGGGIAIGQVDGNGANMVQGNFIGTDVTGSLALGNRVGLFILGPNNLIGGTTPAARNIVSSSTNTGIIIGFLSILRGNVVQGNFIGTDVTGNSALPNSLGIGADGGADTLIGGTVSGAGNTIRFNNDTGVVFADFGTGNSILGNSISSNAGLGIDISVPILVASRDGVTPNDSCDADTGPNNLQNFPVLTSATSGASSTNIRGTLDSTPNTAFRIEFFANEACDPSGFGEGQTFIGSTTAITGSDCAASFNVTLPVAVPAGQVITATATDPAGNTSEFSHCAQVAQGSSFDLCLQDESNGNLLLINSTTGDYQFTNCRGVALSGTGNIIRRGCFVTLDVSGPDRRVLVRLDTCVKSGTASIQIFSQGMTFTIQDRNTANNTCACAGGSS